MKRRSVLAWIGLLILPAVIGAEPAAKHAAVTPVPKKDTWLDRHERFNARAQQGDVDLLFIGDSITYGWDFDGKDVWDKYYGKRKAMNIGVGGDRTQHVLWRLDHGNIDGLSPKAAVLMIGTNNSNRNDHTAREIGEGIVAIVNTLRAKLPETKILVLGIFPRGPKPSDQRAKNAEASQMAAKLADDKMIHYMDIGVHFLKPDGRLTTDIMSDYLHLTPQGYLRWAIAIEGKLRELLGENP